MRSVESTDRGDPKMRKHETNSVTSAPRAQQKNESAHDCNKESFESFDKWMERIRRAVQKHRWIEKGS